MSLINKYYALDKNYRGLIKNVDYYIEVNYDKLKNKREDIFNTIFLDNKEFFEDFTQEVHYKILWLLENEQLNESKINRIIQKHNDVLNLCHNYLNENKIGTLINVIEEFKYDLYNSINRNKL